MKAERWTMSKIMTTSTVKPVRGLGELPAPLKAIRAQCLNCCCDLPAGVAACPVTSCPLWPWRFGSGTRARRIIAQERELSGVKDPWWAGELSNPTGAKGQEGR